MNLPLVALAVVMILQTPPTGTGTPADTRRVQPIQGPVLWLDGMEEMKVRLRKVGEIRPVNRSPLFRNAPFLRLKPGDALVQGRIIRDPGKPWSPPPGHGLDAFVVSGGQHYEIDVQAHRKHVDLNDAICSVRFDWEPSLEHAVKLWDLITPPRVRLTTQQYANLARAIAAAFPACMTGCPRTLELPPPQWDSKGQGHATLESLGFDDLGNSIYKEISHIGPGVFRVFRENLIVGPRHVNQDEFMGYHPTGNAPNQGLPWDVPPEIAKIKRAEYKVSQRFKRLVARILKRG